MIYHILFFSHIIFGGIALILGAIAALSKKGDNLHRSTGKYFVYSMLAVALTAVVMSLMKPQPFLLGIGTFSLYLSLSGGIWAKRITINRRTHIAKRLGILGILSSLGMFYMALIGSQNAQIILLVFGSIQLLLALTDLLRKVEPTRAIARHAGRIGGAYIATITAFLVVNNKFLPPLLVWLGPSLIGTVLIALGTRKWYAKNR